MVRAGNQEYICGPVDDAKVKLKGMAAIRPDITELSGRPVRIWDIAIRETEKETSSSGLHTAVVPIVGSQNPEI